MRIKLFGKDLFEWKSKKKSEYFIEVQASANESKFLPDFTEANEDNSLRGVISTANVTEGAVSKKPVKPSVTPKELYLLKTLHDTAFKLNVEPEYLDKQIETFKDKLGILNSTEYDMRRGINEVSSVLIRLENRRKYSAHHEFFSQYPYTTTSRINKVLKGYANLELGKIAQFVAGLPAEATKAMKVYNGETKKLCEKQSVFYIIADKKDFQKTDKRRDPILLAQSPFAHVWQIIGAWDKEMVLLEEL